MSALAAAVADLRLRFAEAKCRKELEDGIEEAKVPLKRAPREAGERYAALRSASAACHYMYLLRRPPADIFAVLEEAWSLFAKDEPFSELRMRAELAVHVSYHRFFRQSWRPLQLQERARRADRIAKKLQREYPEAEELSEWELERAHFARYQGLWNVALPSYGRLATRTWHPAGQPYQSVVLEHYGVSAPCDLLELLFDTDGYATSNHELAQAVEECARQTLRVLERSSAATPNFPMFSAHHLKHKALCLAILRDEKGARECLKESLVIFRALGIPKGLFLSHEFSALVDLRFGNKQKALTKLRRVERATQEYYPRAATMCRYHLGRALLPVDASRQDAKFYITGLRAVESIQNRNLDTMSRAMEEGIERGRSAMWILQPPHEVVKEFTDFAEYWSRCAGRDVSLPSGNTADAALTWVVRCAEAGVIPHRRAGIRLGVGAERDSIVLNRRRDYLRSWRIGSAERYLADLRSNRLDDGIWAPAGILIGLVISSFTTLDVGTGMALGLAIFLAATSLLNLAAQSPASGRNQSQTR